MKMLLDSGLVKLMGEESRPSTPPEEKELNKK